MAEITGKYVFAITASAFAVIIGVNLVLAFKAVSTFPGLEVKNSYVVHGCLIQRRFQEYARGTGAWYRPSS